MYVPGIIIPRILIIANKRIHIISAYFLAAASDKRMRLLTSLYGMVDSSYNRGSGWGVSYYSHDITVWQLADIICNDRTPFKGG